MTILLRLSQELFIELILKRTFTKSLNLIYVLPFVLLGLGFFLRLSYAIKGSDISDTLWSDMEIYFKISNQISEGSWKAYHFFQSIGYPLFIIQLGKIYPNIFTSLIVVQTAASCISLFIFYRLTSASLGKTIGLISLGIGAVHMPWILYTNFALPESLFVLCLSVSAWYAWKIASSEKPAIKDGILWAVFFMLGFWLKGTHALWGPLFLASILIVKKKVSVPAMFFLCCVVASSLALHGLLTYNKIGKIQLSASTGGLNFIEGKCPDKVNMDTAGYRWHSPLYYQLELKSAKRWDRPFTESGYFFRQGLKCIKKDPFVLLQSFESIPYLFFGNTMWPFNRMPYARYTRLYELFFAVFAIAGLAFYAINSYRRGINSTEFITWVIPILSLFLCVYIFKSEMRYRIPFDLWIIPLGVKGWFDMCASKK